jgi:aryl-alcohol dehydrogenase-like predicted oxidoreductase
LDAAFPAHSLRQPPQKRHRLEENLGAAAVDLTTDDLAEIQTAASKITVQGARYPEHLERLTGG